MNETQISLKFKNSVTGIKKIEKYNSLLNELNSTLNNIDLNKTSNNLSKLSSSSKGTTVINKNITNIQKSSDATSKSISSLGKNINLAFAVGKVMLFARALTRVTKALSSNVTKSATYLENLNLLDVAYNNDTTEAKKFVGTLSDMYGLDESWGYRQVGIFKQLANAMGLSNEAGDKLAKTLTQLAIDTSSLYNIDVDETSQILQSGLAGQTKPVRRLGGDITMSTLQTTLDKNGIDKNISQLSYAEKRLVIVASLLDQTKQAQGDWGRTIESVANQMRIFEEQTSRLGRAIGNVFLPMVKALLPYLNGILMALVEIVNYIAKLVGYSEEDFDFFGSTDTNELLDDINGVGDGLDSASESAKKLKQGLRGFDKLNNITTPSSSGTSGGGASGTGVSADILDLFNKKSDEYFASLDKIEMKATKIKNAILNGLNEIKGAIDLLNFEPLIDSVVRYGQQIYRIIDEAIIPLATAITTQLVAPIIKKMIEEWLPDIYNSLATILEQIDFSGITENIIKNFDIIRNIIFDIGDSISSIIKLISKPLGKAINTITKLTTNIYSFAILPISATIHNIKNALSILIDIVQPLIDLIGDGLDTLSKIYDWVGNNIYPIVKSIFEDYIKPISDEITKIYKLGIKIRDEFVGAVFNKLKDILTKILEPAKKQISQIYNDYLKPIIKDITDFYNNYLKPIFDLLGEIKDKIINFISDHVKDIKKAVEFMYTPIEKIVEFIAKILGFLISISPLVNSIKVSFTVIKTIIEEFIIPLVNKLYNIFKDNVKPIIDKIVTKFSEIYTWIKDNIIPKVEKLYNWFKDMYEKYIKPIADKIKEIKEKLDAFKSKVIDFTINFIAKGAVDLAKKAFNIATYTNPIGLAYHLISGKKDGGIFNGKQWLDFPQYASGGLPSAGQLFVANERGPELVGQIGGQTFVANQRQVLGMMKRNGNGTSVNPTIVVQVGDKEIARQVISDLQDMASSNGKPITIGAN